MEIEDTPLQNEIEAILRKGSNPVHSQWRCLIELPDNQGFIEPFKLFSLDIERRYDEHYGDYIVADLAFPMGTFNKKVYPNKEALIAIVTRYPLGEVESSPTALDDEPTGYRFRAFLTKESSDTIESPDNRSQNEETGNLTDIVRVEMQFLEPALEQLRNVEVGGIYKGDLPGDILKHSLTEASQTLELPDEDGVRGVEMVPPDNQQPVNQLVVPHGVRMVDLAYYIQNEWAGLYNTGIGCYLQQGTWYVWPMYNIRRFDEEPRNITFINLPQNRYSEIERTYRVEGEHVIALVTGEVTQSDFSQYDQLNRGNATRFTNADRVFEGFGETRDNKHEIKRHQNNSEYSAIERKDYNVSPISKERITNNVFAQNSKLASRQGFFVSLVWENAEPELLYPGMPAMFLYFDGEEVVEVEGVLIRVHFFIHDVLPGVERDRHRCNAAILLFLNPVTKGDS